MGFSKTIKSFDKTKNNFGCILLNFCRIFTTKKSCVVDYFISSVEFLKHIIDFSVLDFSRLYSNIHMPLFCERNVNTQIQNVFNSIDTDYIAIVCHWFIMHKNKTLDYRETVTFLENIDIHDFEFYPL